MLGKFFAITFVVFTAYLIGLDALNCHYGFGPKNTTKDIKSVNCTRDVLEKTREKLTEIYKSVPAIPTNMTNTTIQCIGLTFQNKTNSYFYRGCYINETICGSGFKDSNAKSEKCTQCKTDNCNSPAGRSVAQTGVIGLSAILVYIAKFFAINN